MARPTGPCPSCGSAEVRPLTRKEWRERNGGQDVLVVVMPLLCPACGHVWEPKLLRGTCYLIATLAGIVSLICGAAFVVGVSALIWAVFVRQPQPTDKPVSRGVAPLVIVTGSSLATAIGTGLACRKYLRRARE